MGKTERLIIIFNLIDCIESQLSMRYNELISLETYLIKYWDDNYED